MLEKKLSRSEIVDLLKVGRKTYSTHFTLIYKEGSPEDPFYSPVFVASKKIWKSAVYRNKAKRRAREAFRKFLKDKEIKNKQRVFLLKKPIVEEDFKILVREFGKFS